MLQLHTIATKILLITLVVGGVSLISCADHGIVQADNSFLDILFVSGTICADLRSVNPDPISCELLFVAMNKSTSEPMGGLNIDSADVLLDSTNQFLGTIAFTSKWDGALSANEQDTVRLTKVQSQEKLFEPPCGYRVYLAIHIQKNGVAFGSAITDRLEFLCLE